MANLIKEQLESIVASTQLNPQAPPGVTVTVIPKCTGTQVSENSLGRGGGLLIIWCSTAGPRRVGTSTSIAKGVQEQFRKYFLNCVCTMCEGYG